MHACMTHQLKKSKPFCASFVASTYKDRTPRQELGIGRPPNFTHIVAIHSDAYGRSRCMAGADAWQEQGQRAH